MDVRVQVLSRLDRAGDDALTALVERCEAADQHPVLTEDIRDRAGRIHLSPPRRAVLVEVGGGLVGCATLTPGADGWTVVHLAVDPAFRKGAGDGTGEGNAEGVDIRAALVSRALAEATGPVRLWLMRDGRHGDGALADLGLRPERDLLQLRVALPLPDDVVAAARPVRTRAFRPGLDEQAWLDVNNRAFAGHPEQGHWTLETLQNREEASWFDPAGFLVAEDEAGAVVGSCWTKVHRQRRPVLGEIYVIAVDPSRHGQGWGRALTVAGLQWLAAQDITVGMLYTDAANTAAVALYRSLGFTVDHVDRSYRGAEVGVPQPAPVPMARPTP